jgi:hypothetical protein
MNNKNSIHTHAMFCKNRYTFFDYIQAGLGLSISNRYADWFFGRKYKSNCKINKKNYNNCLDGNIVECIQFMELLRKCNYTV